MVLTDALQFNAVGHGRPGTLRPLPSPLLPRGTKIDLRKNAQSTSSVSRREGRRLAARLGMSNYVECSAKTGQGCQQAFRSAIQATTAKPTCILL
nr:GTP-binding protein RHO1-like [Penaeus vannamei]